MRVVVDTDVVLSSLRSAAGASRLILLAIREGAITLLASVAIMLEYESVLKRGDNLSVIGASAAEIDMLLDALALLAEPVSPGFFHRPSIRDPDDKIFVEAAVNSHADALVTFNRGDYLPADDRAMP
jgi:putative PIN family toxin of toxin-antitoxin system